MSHPKKQEIVTFKVDPSLAELLKAIPNRSEFIRSAILTALESGCPLCQGTGTLSPAQLEHWAAFSATHSIKKCDQCNAMHVVCDRKETQASHRNGPRGARLHHRSEDA